MLPHANLVRRGVPIVLMVACLLFASCYRATDPAAPVAPIAGEEAESVTASLLPEVLESEFLPNLVQVHPLVYSGGEPHGEEAFRELRARNIRTIISVDGARPNLPLARKYGLRYVHLPHGYDGVPPDRVRDLARAITALEGPFYLHCHHGKHRSPAAASAACQAAGWISTEVGLKTLRLAGTSDHYRGLFRTVQETRPLPAAELARAESETDEELFPEWAELPPLAESMVAWEEILGYLREIAAAGWQSPPRHPDLEPAHQALLMREGYTELLREELDQPAAFRELLEEGLAAARDLESAMRAEAPMPGREELAHAREEALSRLVGNCRACHEAFRDNK